MTTQKISQQSGASQLLLVLIISTILALVTSAIMVVSFVDTKRSARLDFSQTAYFAAEGALFETIKDIEANYQQWINKTPYQDQYFIGNTTIYRNVTKSDGILTISITADNKNTRKKLIGKYSPEVSVTTNTTDSLDIMLVIDRSGSMSDTDDSGKSSLKYAVDGARLFLDTIYSRTTDAWVGILTFNHYVDDYDDEVEHIDVEPVPPSEKQDLYDRLDELYASTPTGGTNIAWALYGAKDTLISDGRDGIPKAIIILSDGVPQFAHPWNTSPTSTSNYECLFNNNQEIRSCETDACWRLQADSDPWEPWYPPIQKVYHPEEGYEARFPVGNCCTAYAVWEAHDAKYDYKYPIYSIALTSNYTDSAASCVADYGETGALEKTKLLGSLTMFNISSETENKPYRDKNNDGVFDPEEEYEYLDGFDPNKEYTYYKETADPSALEPIFQQIAEQVTNPTLFEYVEAEPNQDPFK